jgi:hypothetical protein
VGVHYNVRFVAGAETAYVDTDGNMVIPMPNSAMTLRDAIRLRGFCLHEMSHPLWQPEIFDIMRKHPTKQGSPLGGIFNILLDVHAETRTAQAYAGDAKALSEFGAVVGHDVFERLDKVLKDNGNVFPDNFKKMCAVMNAGRIAEATWNVGMHVGFQRLVNDVYTKEIRDISDDLVKRFKLTERLVDNARDIDEWAIWDLSKEVHEYLWPDKGGEADMPKPQSTAVPVPSSGAEKGTSEDEQEQLEEKIPISELVLTDHYETLVGKGGTGQGFDYAKYNAHPTYTPVDPNTFIVTDYAKKRR